jgi:uncharacterized protein (TIGR03382 family)
MMRRALLVALFVCLSGPALATDDTDTAVDTDDPGGSTAAELANEAGGADCSHLGSAALAPPVLLLGLVLVARRRL